MATNIIFLSWCSHFVFIFSPAEGSIFVVGGQSGQQIGSTCVDEFLVREACWRERAPLAYRRQQHAAAVVVVGAAAGQDGGERALIGIFGGCYKEGEAWITRTSCELYDVAQNRWQKLPNLPEKRFGLAAASLPGNDRVFVFGGSSDTSAHASVWFCRLRADWQERARSASPTEFWQRAASMGTARFNLAAATFRGRILVVGGQNRKEEDVNVVEIFSPPDARCPLGQWTALDCMNRRRSFFSLLASGDAVFAFGSREKPANTVETFAAPDGLSHLGNNFTAWSWSTNSPVRTLGRICGAAYVHL